MYRLQQKYLEYEYKKELITSGIGAFGLVEYLLYRSPEDLEIDMFLELDDGGVELVEFHIAIGLVKKRKAGGYSYETGKCSLNSFREMA